MISPPDGVACTVLMILPDMTYLFGVHTVLLANFMELSLLGPVNQKLKFQRLNKITDKTKNNLSLHNSKTFDNLK